VAIIDRVADDQNRRDDDRGSLSSEPELAPPRNEAPQPPPEIDEDPLARDSAVSVRLHLGFGCREELT
jgi:hypothetical protein